MTDRISLNIYLIITVLLVLSMSLFAQDSTQVSDPTQTDSLQIVDLDSLKYAPFKSMQFDSTLIQGSDYGSFADIFDWLPGTYWYDRGSIGQLAEGFLFGGTPSSFVLEYDGMVLNDPLTGKADLNLIPTESVDKMGIVLSSVDKTSLFNPVGQTMQISSLDMASLPIRSRVAYRTGTSFDDNDVRLGIQASPKMKINVGGILKNYAGTLFHSKYRAQKINLKIDRVFREKWNFRYVLLLNKYDLDIPYLKNYSDPDHFRLPHQKDVRYDHGFFLKRGRFSSTLQYTSLEREFYGYRHSIVDQIHDVNSLRFENQYLLPTALADFKFGTRWNWTQLKSNEWGDQWRWSLGGVISGVRKVKDNLLLSGDIQVNKPNNYDLYFQPAIHLTWKLKQDFTLNSWYNHIVNIPSFESLCETGPLRLGDEDLLPEKIEQIGTAMEIRSANFVLNIANTFQFYKNHITVSDFNKYYEGSTLFDYPYMNLKKFYFYAFNIQNELLLSDYVSFVSKIDVFYQFDSREEFANLPRYFGKSYLDFHNVFEKYGLDARIRIGSELVGPYHIANPFHYIVTDYWNMQKYQVLPYIHAIFKIRDVTLFAALLNPVGNYYERVYELPHPNRAQLRWGFSWNFLD